MAELVEFVEFCAIAEEISKASAAKPRQVNAIVTEDLGKYDQGHNKRRHQRFKYRRYGAKI
jgi:hypothetical protein